MVFSVNWSWFGDNCLHIEQKRNFLYIMLENFMNIHDISCEYLVFIKYTERVIYTFILCHQKSLYLNNLSWVKSHNLCKPIITARLISKLLFFYLSDSSIYNITSISVIYLIFYYYLIIR